MRLVFWVYLRVLAVVVYVQYIGSQFYDPTSEGLAEAIYRIIDPLMVLGMLIAVYFAYQRKRRRHRSGQRSQQGIPGSQRHLLHQHCSSGRPAMELGRLPVCRSLDDAQLALGSD